MHAHRALLNRIKLEQHQHHHHHRCLGTSIVIAIKNDKPPYGMMRYGKKQDTSNVDVSKLELFRAMPAPIQG